MFQTLRTPLAIASAFALALLAPVMGGAQNLTDRDSTEVAGYVLTEAVLAKYAQAVRKLQPVMGQLPQECDGDEGPKSLNDVAAHMDGVPQVKSALKTAGLTSREYLLSPGRCSRTAWLRGRSISLEAICLPA
jgi:hypothetical protein